MRKHLLPLLAVSNLIADMNRQRLAFTVHDGDIKSGSSACTDDVYLSFAASMNTLRAPAMFTPGDNDWTDCDRGPFGNHQENGDNDGNWLKVTVDPRSREVFSFQPQIVPGNRTAVPPA
jgi:hypothetical protein